MRRGRCAAHRRKRAAFRAGALPLLRQNGRILPREALLSALWDDREKFISDNTLSVHVSRLRKKLGLYQGAPYIETVKHIGYRWNGEVRSAI